MEKPEIIVHSKDSDDVFRWMSVDWFKMRAQHTKKAKDLMRKAKRCIIKAENVVEAKALLRKAGFVIRLEGE